MRILFGNWKYLFANFWYVLPFAIVPAVFFAFTLDYSATSAFMNGLTAGDPRTDFLQFFRVWSMVRVDGWLGALLSLCAFLSAVVAMALILSFVEKHMRIGKRTLGGVFSQFKRAILPAFVIGLVFVALYELWAVVLSAVSFAISAIQSTFLVYAGETIVFLLSTFVLIFCISVFFLWLPCAQITGYGPYNSFLYAYHLYARVRWKLLFSLLISFVASLTILGCCAYLPEYVFRIIAFGVCLLAFPAFCVRMVVVYYATDALDREDVIRSYREL